MTITDIITEFGAYYLNHGQNLKDLVKQLYRKSVTDMLFTTMTTEDTVIRKSDARITRILQPFQKQFTPIGTLSFKPVTIPLFEMKIDASEYPDELERSWLGFLADQDLDRQKWPFVKWFITEHILPRAEEDYELNEVYAGVYAAPTPGTAGAAGTAMDGIRKIINDWIDDGRTTPIVTGAPDSDPQTFVEQIEDFVAQIDTRYWKETMVIAMYESLELRYRKGMRAKYNMQYLQEPNTSTLADFKNITIAGMPSMVGDDKIWCTPKWNAVVGVKKKANQNAVQLEGEDRKVKLWSDWYKGVGFIIPELIFTNDQDLV